MSRFPRLPTFLRLGVVVSLAIAASLVFASDVSAQTTRHVATTGSDAANDCTVQANPCATIQHAINESVPGDTVQVGPGTYAESVNLGAMDTPGNITLISPKAGDATVSPAAGAGIFHKATFPGDITIDGFVVTSPDGPGIFAFVNSDVVITNVTANNSSGDGVNATSSTGNVTVTNSTANDTGGIGFVLRTVKGDITVTDSTANGNAADGFVLFAEDGTVTVTGSTANGNGGHGFDIPGSGNVTISGSEANDNTGLGMLVFADGIMVDGSTANGNLRWGFDLFARGDLTIGNSVANGNGVVAVGGNCDGRDVDFDGFNVGGNVTVSDTTANSNCDDGFSVNKDEIVSGAIAISGSTTNENSDDGMDLATGGNVSVTDSTANSNGDEGFQIDVGGDVTLDRVTANGNDDDGADIECLEDDGCKVQQEIVVGLVDNITIKDSFFSGNGGSGVDFDKKNEHEINGTYLVNGNIICQNKLNGFEQNSAITTDAKGNWWGASSGPKHLDRNAGGAGDPVVDAGNPAGEGPGLGTADFNPWLETITSTVTVNPVTLGGSTTISFPWPGDPNIPAPFDPVTDIPNTGNPKTNNGTLTSSINKANGTLEVILTPATEGSATVTVTGPCGLSGSATVVVAPAPTPTATPPAPTPTAVLGVEQLPTTGGEPAGGSSALAWLALGIGALIVTSGGLALAYQRRRVR